MIDPVGSFSDFTRCVQRTLAEKTKSVRVARPQLPEILQFFREIFAQILRNLDAGRILIRIRTHFPLHQELQRR